MKIILPFPSSRLSGHNTGHYHAKAGVVAQHREWARNEALKANLTAPAKGDITVSVRFIPPDNRGDRINFPNRMKPYFDGIADALKVNDKRFIPFYMFAEPAKPGCVEVWL
jgi:crossover junction endodeoxyribonuclease RusA